MNARHFMMGLITITTILGLSGCNQEDPKQVTTPDAIGEQPLRHTTQPIVEHATTPSRPLSVETATTSSQAIAEYNTHPTLPPTETVFGGNVKIIKTENTERKSIEWVLATDYFEGNVGFQAFRHEGSRYIKAGVSRQMRTNQRDWLRGKDGSQGVIYSMHNSALLHRIHSVRLESDGELKIPGFASIMQMTVSIDGGNHKLFCREELKDGKFGWYDESGIIYVSAKEVVPKGYRPFYSLRVRGMVGFDTTEPSPQILDVSTFRQNEASHVRLRGMQLRSSSGIIREAFVIAPISQLQTEDVKIVNYGDGSFKLYDKNASVDGETVQRLVGVPSVIAEPLSERSWNIRREYLHPYAGPLP